jgi:SAM-dependent methyltransferase
MSVADHYSRFDGDADLFRSDQLHTLGPLATSALAELAGIAAGERVLDVGCGIGGPARHLASMGAVVTGIDLTPAFCAAARTLNERAGVDIDIRQGSALALPWDDGTFDVVWTQHVTMNIEDKAGVYREARRVLREGGRLAFFDVIAGPNQPIHLPVPWADDASISFLVDESTMRSLVEGAGFAVREWHDRTAQALRAHGSAPPNEVIPDWERKVATHRRNLEEDRTRLLQAVCDAG